MIFFVCLDAENVFEFLNFHHKNIKFILEKESHKCLSLLDIFIKNEGNRFSTSVYRKKKKYQLGCLHSLVILHQ